MQVCIIGHWQVAGQSDVYDVMRENSTGLDGDGCADQRDKRQVVERVASSFAALSALQRGMVSHDANIEASCLLFGGGRDFADSLAQAGEGFVGISIPADCADAYELGKRVSAGVAAGQRVVLEGGHTQASVLWPSFLAGALGFSENALSLDSPDEVIVGACVELRELWGGNPARMVVSTARPLVGLSSVVSTSPDLSLRHEVSPAQAQQMRQVLALAHKQCAPQLLDTSIDPASLPGSGAGGGIAALFAVLGGLLTPTGDFLRHSLKLDEFLSEKVDVVVVAHPGLHSPMLAESTLDSITDSAAQHALPVVAVGVDSSLSRHECAQWGLHGVLLSADMEEALENVGRRIAHTWGRRLRRG